LLTAQGALCYGHYANVNVKFLRDMVLNL
jgi:hypothetical protein